MFLNKKKGQVEMEVRGEEEVFLSVGEMEERGGNRKREVRRGSEHRSTGKDCPYLSVEECLMVWEGL